MDEQESNSVEQLGYPIPVSRARWSLTLALLTLAVVIVTLALLLSGNPADRPLWLLLVLSVAGVFSAIVTYVLVRALLGVGRQAA